MQNNERSADQEELYRSMQTAHQAGIWTSMPGIITAVNYAAVTASVQPAVKGRQRSQDGSVADVSMPLCVDVPLIFQRGGGYRMTLPVRAGDECLLVFASRCIDAWWSQGGQGTQLDSRMHDLSDAFAIVGPFSQKTKPGAISATDVQLVSDDGSQLISLGPSGATVKAAQIALMGAVAITGASLTHNGKNIGSSHTHTNVQPGGGTSGPPS